tara:strand:+ start:385 stop:585 length:201 start_codon:yes stop_codon:yes gene_type:complete
MKRFSQFMEDIPANNASSGNIAGLGSEPPVSVKGQKAHQKRVDKLSKGATAGRRGLGPKMVGMDGY